MAAPLDYAGALIDALADDDRDAAVALQDLALDAAQGPSDGLGDGSPDVAARVRADMTAWIRARMAEGGKCAACDAAQESRRETARLRESGEHHRKGDVWQGPSGHWFTITASGHVAPAKAPGGGDAPEPAASADAKAPDGATVRRDLFDLHAATTDRRSGLSKPLPALFDELRKKHPGLSEDEFYRELDSMQRDGLLTIQAGFEAGETEAAGVPKSRFRQRPGGRAGLATWVTFRPDARARIDAAAPKPAEPAAKAPAPAPAPAPPAADHPLAFLKDTHGIDLTGLPPDAVEAIRQALAPAEKPKAAPKPAAETPPHLVAAADRVKALAQTANDPDVTREQIDAGLDALGLDKLPLAELQALGRHLSRDPADLKTKAGAVKAIRRIAQDAKELLVRGGG